MQFRLIVSSRIGLLCLRKLKGALQGYNSVKYHFFRSRILVVHTEEAVSYKLEAVKGLSALEARLQVRMLYHGQGDWDSGFRPAILIVIRPFPSSMMFSYRRTSASMA